MTEQNEITNRLGLETSLYLRQHADNPVAWQPWGDEALALARDTGRPILLSIGYSACHWCHVMAHESFEDEATAAVMNDLYVNIKVDREERPDLDKIYQLSHQLLTGRGGGWPLTLFIDPADQVPFFAGTYFPLVPRYGMPSFRDILVRARQWFDENPDDVKSQGERLQQAIESMQRAPAVPPTAGTAVEGEHLALLQKAAATLDQRFDRQHGGFGGAPKFPQAPQLELAALVATASSLGKDAGQSLLFTLERMAASGLRDHLDGGFFRYCVDGEWTIPHFEKMLYDNAQLLPLYAEAARRSANPSLAQTAAGIVSWLRQSMLQDNGGFSASIDADADGEEGGFHVWQRDEVEALLDAEQFSAVASAYGLGGPPNFEHKAWHLIGAVESGDDPAALVAARQQLREKRELRVHPTLDPKQIVAWNALTASGLLRAARALGRDDWIGLAQGVLDFIRSECRDGDRLLAVHNEGRSRFAGYIDDYAFTLEALLESLRARWRSADLDFALGLADAVLARFEDTNHGGFFFSDASEDVPIARHMVMQDDATPSGYAAAASALLTLSSLTGEMRYLDAAHNALARARGDAVQHPLAFATVFRALLAAEQPQAQVIIRGHDPALMNEWKMRVERDFPVKCYAVRSDGGGREGAGEESPLPGLLAEMRTREPASAWLCRGMTCLPPVQSLEALLQALES